MLQKKKDKCSSGENSAISQRPMACCEQTLSNSSESLQLLMHEYSVKKKRMKCAEKALNDFDIDNNT